MGQAGGIGALPGFGGVQFGGNNGMQAGLTGAVKGTGGQLTEYNPGTMSETTKAPPPSTAPEFTAAGMDATTGMPSYVTNWLQSGGTGTMPTSTGVMPASPAQQSTAQEIVAPTGAAKLAPNQVAAAEKIKSVPKPAVTAGAGAGAAAKTDPMAGLTAIPFNAAGGYNQPGLQQPMNVSDQWNGSSSQQMATPQLGQQNSPQMAAGSAILMDGKGGFFMKDAKTGKPVPLTGVGLTTAQGIAKSMGYR